MERSELSVELRTGTRKGVARKIRAKGMIPAILYGHGLENVMLAVDPRALMKAVDTEAGTNTLIRLTIGGRSEEGEKVVLLRDLQVDPIKRVPLHADLYQIRMDEAIEVDVPIRLIGKAAGIDEGGILDQGLRELRVECLPGSIPEVVEVDVTALGIGDLIHVSDLIVPAGVKIIEELTTTVATVTSPMAEEEAAAPVEGELPAGEVAPGAEGAEAPAEGAAAADGDAKGKGDAKAKAKGKDD
ncbi:MAG: 50S ribosomal protein L25 [Deltaproteobacteria bacterium]|nr:50S ribosomal protein L25 [Deltaproteobacteria bacterium]